MCRNQDVSLIKINSASKVFMEIFCDIRFLSVFDVGIVFISCVVVSYVKFDQKKICHKIKLIRIQHYYGTREFAFLHVWTKWFLFVFFFVVLSNHRLLLIDNVGSKAFKDIYISVCCEMETKSYEDAVTKSPKQCKRGSVLAQRQYSVSKL